MLKSSIITIGDELLIGQVINTNAAFIAKELTSIGAQVINQFVIGDEKNQIVDTLNEALKTTDVVFITGGLGPTHDDITKAVLAEYFETKLVLNTEISDKLQARYAKSGIKYNETNKYQAYVPEKCTVFYNKVGSAPGMFFEKDQKFIFSLPGVPQEMQHLTVDYIIPLLKDKIIKENIDVLLTKTIHTSGIPESALADLLGNPKNFLHSSALAFLPAAAGVRLRINSTGKTFSDAEKEIKRISNYIYSKADKYIIGEDSDTLPNVLGKELLKNNYTLSIAESCTGGLLGSIITEIPGSSKYFLGGIISYSNNVKEKNIGVSHSTLEQHGAVSEETAREMAEGTKKLLNSDFALSITGIAGPDGGNTDKPVGTVYIGLADKNTCTVQKFSFMGNREMIRSRSAFTAIRLLVNYLKMN